MTTYSPSYGGVVAMPRRENKLAGKQVSPAMLNDAYAAKKAGRRVILVSAGALDTIPGADGDCPNCAGFGQLGLEVLMSGPFEHYPTKAKGPANDDGDTLLVAVTHNGGWYTAARTMYPCPTCRDEIAL